MATKVAGELYHELDGQLWEIKRQLRQLSGYPFDPEGLKKHLQDAVEGRFAGSPLPFRYDRRKDGWCLVEDSLGVVEISNLEIIPFLRGDEGSISGGELHKRALELGGNFGQRQAEYLFEHEDEIPVGWRDYYLVFPGTLLRTPDGYLLVPYLCWRGGRGWCLDFGGCGGGGSSGRLVCHSK